MYSLKNICVYLCILCLISSCVCVGDNLSLCTGPGEAERCSKWWPGHFRRKASFLQSYAGYDVGIEDIAASNLERFRGQVYLDYGGSGVYQSHQLRSHYEELIENAYGNAHSHNPSADRTDKVSKEARQLVREFFNASPSNYISIFTSGATQAFKIVGENFKWSENSLFYYLRINHMSVLGIREYTHQHGCIFRAVSADEIEEILSKRKKQAQEKQLDVHRMKQNRSLVAATRPQCLFAYPAKDNFSGFYYPLRWVNDIQRYGLSDDCDWRVLLDAAAYSASNRLDVAKYPADFVGISFYKLFGYPSGLGTLLLKQDAADSLTKTYFGGGAVVTAACDSHWCQMKKAGPEKWEDGTVSFLAIASLRFGFQKLYDVGMDKISAHVASLTRYLVDEMRKLRHSNGSPVVYFYGPAIWNMNGRSTDENVATTNHGAEGVHGRPIAYDVAQGDMSGKGSLGPHGGFVAFNVLDSGGHPVPYGEVEEQASDAMIHLRTGCFCNPGACQDMLGFTLQDVMQASQCRESCSESCHASFIAKAGQAPPLFPQSSTPAPTTDKPLAAVRISLGYLSTFSDVEKFLQFLSTNFKN